MYFAHFLLEGEPKYFLYNFFLFVCNSKLHFLNFDFKCSTRDRDLAGFVHI